MGPGFTPLEDDDDGVIRFGVAPASMTLTFRHELSSSSSHSSLLSNYYGRKVFSLSSVAAPIFVGITGNSSGISCQPESVMSCLFDPLMMNLFQRVFRLSAYSHRA